MPSLKSKSPPCAATAAVSLFLAATLVLVLAPSLAMGWTGKCTRVVDGDTIHVLAEDGATVKIRLYGIDAPERGQDFGKRAKQSLAAMVGNDVVVVEEMDVDRYGCVVALVYQRGKSYSVNMALVSKGMAWVYERYCREGFCGEWLDLQAAARRQGTGLWGQGQPVPPWKWRRR